MLISSLEAKAFRDRLSLSLITGAGLGVMAVLAVWMFAGFGASAANILTDIPEALSALIGASGGGNGAVSEMFSLIAPIVVLSVAVSGGVNALAGEERDHTAGLLLAQPVTRRHVVRAKAEVLVAHVLITSGLFLAGFVAASALFGTGVSSADALAASVHLATLGVAFGMVALSVSALTGSTTASLGVTAGLAVAANLAATMLPLVDRLKGFAKASPWHYYDGSRPLSNGIDPAHLLVLVALGAIAYGLALAVVDHRDIGSGDQRGFIAMIPALDRFTRPSVSGVFAKALSERAILVSMAGGYVAITAVGTCLMFNGLKDTLSKLSHDLPDAIARLVGGVDMGTPVGWINAELLSIMLPLVLVAVAVVIGVAAIAGEQKRHTLDLLLAAPVSRRRIVIDKAAAMIVTLVAIAVMWGIGIMAGSAIAGLGLDVGHVAAALAQLTLLAAFFGAVALALGSVASSRVALGASGAIALASYFTESFFPLNAGLRRWAVLSPWHYYNASHPLARGLSAGHAFVLALASALAVLAAALLVDRREVTA